MIKEFNENDNKNWNDLVSAFNELDYYSLFEWGNFKEKQGWIVKRYLFFEKNNIRLVFQALIKKKFIFKLIWIPGGILGNFNKNEILYIINFLKTKFGRNIVIRISFAKNFKREEYKILNDSKFIKIDSKNYANKTMKLDLSSKKILDKSFTKNWRHNLKRSFKYKNFVLDYDKKMLPKLIKIYREMEEFKNIDKLHDSNTLELLLQELKDLLIFKVYFSNKNDLQSFRCAILFNNYAWDLLAATSIKGRKNYSSYLVTYEILKECIENSVKIFDFSGINKKSNKGVYNFKKGTGSKEFEKLGLWQYHTFSFFNKLFKHLIN